MSSVKDDFITKIILKEMRNRKNKHDTKGLLILIQLKKFKC